MSTEDEPKTVNQMLEIKSNRAEISSKQNEK